MVVKSEMFLNTDALSLIMDRTPNVEDLNRLRRNLDGVVNEISAGIDFETLDAESMKKILIYMGENYPLQELHKSGVDYYDVGYAFLKGQISKELGSKNSLLVDGVMGWLYCNPGTVHKQQMDDALLNYLGTFEIQQLNEGFVRIKNRFKALQSIASQEDVWRVVIPLEKDYATVFLQSNDYFRFREGEIRKLVPEFNPSIS